jgi:L-aspartate oxidase
MSNSYDIVIVGSGIAGLSTVLYLSETHIFKEGQLSIGLVCKGHLDETNTNWAQGGIAAVHAIEDNFEKHLQDTLRAGAYTNNKKIVQKVVHAAPDLLQDLIKWGTAFDKNRDGNYDLAKEGGHSNERIWHKADETGKSIQAALLQRIRLLPNVHIYEQTTVVHVKQHTNDSFGINVYEQVPKTFSSIFASKLVLATGGLGMLYTKSTNQIVTTGDGIYIASQLNAAIENLSFIQFHPTGLYEEGQISFLISEALRGAGAILRNEKGEAFMYKYDERLDLAPRDIVSRAIVSELALQNKSYVYLDATQIDSAILNTHFPAIKLACKERLGLDIENEYIPIVPVQHYSCGGVQVDEFGETTINGLFAIGEIASTGLHGANRLASNSLLEGIAFAKFCIPKLLSLPTHTTIEPATMEIPSYKMIDRKQVQLLMSNYAGIVKTNEGLAKALSQLNEIKNNAILNKAFDLADFESNCILEVAILLIKDALLQTANKGVFYNTDLVK